MPLAKDRSRTGHRFPDISESQILKYPIPPGLPMTLAQSVATDMSLCACAPRHPRSANPMPPSNHSQPQEPQPMQDHVHGTFLHTCTKLPPPYKCIHPLWGPMCTPTQCHAWCVREGCTVPTHGERWNERVSCIRGTRCGFGDVKGTNTDDIGQRGQQG